MLGGGDGALAGRRSLLHIRQLMEASDRQRLQVGVDDVLSRRRAGLLHLVDVLTPLIGAEGTPVLLCSVLASSSKVRS